MSVQYYIRAVMFGVFYYLAFRLSIMLPICETEFEKK